MTEQEVNSKYKISPAALWHDPEDESEDEDENPHWARTKTLQDKPRIINAVEFAFPIPKGWKPTSHEGTVEITSLEHLTIRKITKYFTEPLIEGKRPNAEAAWEAPRRLGIVVLLAC